MSYYAFHKGYVNETEYQAKKGDWLRLYDTKTMKFIDSWQVNMFDARKFKIVNLDKNLVLHYKGNFPSKLSNANAKVSIYYDVGFKRYSISIENEDNIDWLSLQVVKGAGAIKKVNKSLWEFPADEIELSFVHYGVSGYTVRLLFTKNNAGLYRVPVYINLSFNGLSDSYISYDLSTGIKCEDFYDNYAKLANFEGFMYENFSDFILEQKHYMIDKDIFVNCETGEIEKEVPKHNCFNLSFGMVTDALSGVSYNGDYCKTISETNIFLRVGSVEAVLRKADGECELTVNGRRHTISISGGIPNYIVEYDGKCVFEARLTSFIEDIFSIEYIYKHKGYIFISFEDGLFHFILDNNGELAYCLTESNCVVCKHKAVDGHKGAVARLSIVGFPISTKAETFNR